MASNVIYFKFYLQHMDLSSILSSLLLQIEVAVSGSSTNVFDTVSNDRRRVRQTEEPLSWDCECLESRCGSPFFLLRQGRWSANCTNYRANGIGVSALSSESSPFPKYTCPFYALQVTVCIVIQPVVPAIALVVRSSIGSAPFKKPQPIVTGRLVVAIATHDEICILTNHSHVHTGCKQT